MMNYQLLITLEVHVQTEDIVRARANTECLRIYANVVSCPDGFRIVNLELQSHAVDTE